MSSGFGAVGEGGTGWVLGGIDTARSFFCCSLWARWCRRAFFFSLCLGEEEFLLGSGGAKVGVGGVGLDRPRVRKTRRRKAVFSV